MSALHRIKSRLAPLLLGAGIALAAISAAPANEGGRLKDARTRSAENERLADEAAYTSRVCGARIVAVIEWRSVPADKARGMARSCDAALGAIEAMCGSPKEAAKVRKRINRMVCHGDDRAPAIRSGALHFGVRGGGYGAVKRYLDRAL